MKKFIMYRLFTIIFLFIVSVTNAQDLTGIWRGHFRSNTGVDRYLNDDDRYKFEVQIAQHDKIFKAVTYSYKSTVFYGKADADGTFNQKSHKALLRELKIVEVRMLSGDACIMTCFLQYSKLGDDEFLEGTYTSMNTRDSSNCGKGTIFLHKVVNSDFYKEPFVEKREKEIAREENKKPEKKNVDPPVVKKTPPLATAKSKPETKPAITSPKTATGNSVAKNKAPQPRNKPIQKPALAKANTNSLVIQPTKRDSVKIEHKIAPVAVPPVLSNRKNELVKTITVNTNEVELNIYDDGAIDHDTVSVYVDNKLVVSHAMLTDKAIVVKLHMDDDNNYHEVVMVAENEGEIPPNTSLMVVKTGGKEYEVRIVSTEQKNATVVFKFEKN
ncbi:MAG: hypothetical protein JST96_12515 [Bacteroidetes bacterium]|nr:hypothetical protein [Bacteroidota bacterium]